MSEDITKRLAAFEIKVLRRMFGGIKVNENWRKRYNEELLQLFGELDIVVCQSKWIELDWSC